MLFRSNIPYLLGLDVKAKNRIRRQELKEQINRLKWQKNSFVAGSYVNEHYKILWEDYCYKLIEKMFSICKKGIVFNFLTSNNTFTKDDLIYFNPMKILDFCINKLSRFVIVDNCYPLYEVTITVYKKDFIKELYPEGCFIKYFRNF